MKKMMRLHNLVENQMKHGKQPADILKVLAYDLGGLFANSKDEQPFEVLLHAFICNIYQGKKGWEKNENID